MQSHLLQGVWGIVTIVIYRRHWESKPYIRTYVNLDEIFEAAEKYINERKPEITRFEAACTSDIVGIDHLTHSLKRAIEYFGKSE